MRPPRDNSFCWHQQVQWVNKGVERGETLVSISTDGRVVEWSMKKGLSFSPLMVLKRIGEREGERSLFES